MSKKITQERIASMLKENTGRSMLDSGDAYGRNWQRNQAREFDKELPVNFKIHKYGDGPYSYDIDIRINLYHWLSDLLDVTRESARLQKMYDRFTKDSEESHYQDMQNFLDNCLQVKYETVNTYNNPDCDLLSQVIQYAQFENPNDGDQYCLLQIHGGCDIRGGYTSPRVFHIPGYESDYALYRTNEIEIYCDKCDDGRWDFRYWGHTLADEQGQKFDYPVFKQDESPVPYENYVILHDDESASCPLCKTGVLKASPMWNY